MDNKLQELTDKLYNEGLSKGKQEAEALKAAAAKESEQIISEARKEADRILEAARTPRIPHPQDWMSCSPPHCRKNSEHGSRRKPQL